jgi:hypothetical protein
MEDPYENLLPINLNTEAHRKKKAPEDQEEADPPKKVKSTITKMPYVEATLQDVAAVIKDIPLSELHKNSTDDNPVPRHKRASAANPTPDIVPPDMIDPSLIPEQEEATKKEEILVVALKDSGLTDVRTSVDKYDTLILHLEEDALLAETDKDNNEEGQANSQSLNTPPGSPHHEDFDQYGRPM